MTLIYVGQGHDPEYSKGLIIVYELIEIYVFIYIIIII